MNTELFNALEKRIDVLLEGYQSLNQENQRLREENARLLEDKALTIASVDRILAKLEGV